MANTTFTYLSGLLTDANKITQQRAQNLQNLSGIQRANSIANAGYAGGYRRSNQPTQKYTASESAKLKTLAASAANVNLKVPENILDMTSILSKESADKLKTNSGLMNNITSMSLFGPDYTKVASMKELGAVDSSKYLNNRLGIITTNQNKKVYNSTTRQWVVATTFKPLSKYEFEMAVFGDNLTKSKFSDAEKNLVKASQNSKEYQALFAPTQEDIIKASKSGSGAAALVISSKMNEANWRAYVNSMQKNTEYGSSLFKNQAEANKALERQTLTGSVSTGLSDLAKKESELIAQHIKQPYLSMLDTTSYTNYIAEAKANEEKQMKNILLYQAKPQEVNIKKDAQKFGDLATGAYQSAYNELEKSIAAAKTSYDSYVQTKKATKSGFEAILGTLDATSTTASSAQHSLSDTNAATKRKELINQRLDRVSQFTGNSQPIAKFVDRPQ